MKQQTYGLPFLMASMLIFTTIVQAAQAKFDITPLAGSVTALLLPSNFTETVQYQVKNNTKITRTLTMVGITGVTQATNGNGVCSNPFTLAPQQSCILNLTINGSQVLLSGINGGPVVCKTTGSGNPSPDPFLCSKPDIKNTLAVSVTSAGQHAYIANQLNNSISVCQVNPASGFLSQCAITSNGFSLPEGIGLNPAGTFFYAANPGSSSITVCNVNQTNGALSACEDAGGAGFDLPDAIAFNPTGTILYTANFGNNSVSTCLVDTPTGKLSNCNNFTAAFGAPADMSLNSAGTLAYVVNRTTNTTSVCNVSGQVVDSCDNTSGAHFNAPEGVTLSPAGLHAYIANAGDKKVILCGVRQDGTGLLENCSATNGEFDGTGNVGLNQTGTYAYVPNQLLNDVFLCHVNTVSGELSDCKRSRGTGFSGPAGVVLH